MEDCVVGVGVNFLDQSVHGRLRALAGAEVAEDQEAHNWAFGEVTLRLEDELLAPAVGVGTHAVGVEAAQG